MSAVVEVTGQTRESIAALRGELAGILIEPGELGYDEARTVWNAMVDRYPACIVMAESSKDVARAIRFARDANLPLSIRGGGHNIAGTAVSDGGVMINLSRMNAVTVDEITGRVKIGPGANWGDVDRATEPFGLIVPGGMVSTTGVAGFTVGGGFGWMTRKSGYTAETLTAATVVTAAGDILRASPTSNPDLFWGIRGGGGNFGVVTQFEFQPVRLGPEVAAGIVLWPIDQADAVIELFRRVTATAPDELMHVLVLRIAPPAPYLPPEVHGKPIVGIAAFYAGSVEDGLAALEPIKSFGKPLADTIKPKPFKEHQSFLDSGQPFGRRYYWKSVYFNEFGNGVKEALLKHGTEFSSSFSSILLPHLGGSAKRGEAGSTAVSHLDAEYLVNYQASWEDPTQDDTHIAWAKENHASVMPHATGHYVNFMTEDEVQDPARSAFEPAILARLADVKATYDPSNLFRLNKNVAPATT